MIKKELSTWHPHLAPTDKKFLPGPGGGGLAAGGKTDGESDFF